MSTYIVEIYTNRDPRCELRIAGKRYWSEIQWQSILWKGALVDFWNRSREDVFQLRLKHELESMFEQVAFIPPVVKEIGCSHYTFSVCADTQEKVDEVAKELLGLFPYIIFSITVTRQPTE